MKPGVSLTKANADLDTIAVALEKEYPKSNTTRRVYMKGLLESAGIPVVDKGMAEGPYRMGPVDLWVPEEYQDEAKSLIQDAQDPSSE